MKTCCYIIGVLFFSLTTIAQETTPAKKAIILSIEDDKVYLDLGEGSISVGDRLQVIRDRGVFTHPVTGEQIAREPEVIGYIQVTVVRSNYSEGTVSPRGAISALKTGMEASFLKGEDRETREFRKSVAVQPLNVSSAVGGYLGIYIADMITEELFNIDQFRVIDRQTLGWQMDEIALATRGVVDEKEAIRVGKTMGVDYFITGTMYEPDVVDLSTGVPIKGIVGAAEAISGVRMGSELMSDIKISQLRSIVNVTLRVVDVETGEIMFIASEMQQANGRSQINLEQGALGGLQLQGGATSFLNTITGQATKAALKNLSGYINGYFDGTIDVRNFRGNVIEVGGVGTSGERREAKRGRIANVISAEIVFDGNWQVFRVILDDGRNAGFRKISVYGVYEPVFRTSKITDEVRQTGYVQIGELSLGILEDDISQGLITIKDAKYKKPKDYTFSNVIISKRAPKKEAVLINRNLILK